MKTRAQPGDASYSQASGGSSSCMAASLNIPVFEALDVVWDKVVATSTAGPIPAGNLLNQFSNLQAGVYQYEWEAGCITGAAQSLLDFSVGGTAMAIQSFVQLPNGLTARQGLFKLTTLDSVQISATNGFAVGETVKTVLKVKRLAR